MKRITFRSEDGVINTMTLDTDDICERLADYEDTDLTPDEIESMKFRENFYAKQLENACKKDIKDIEELSYYRSHFKSVEEFSRFVTNALYLVETIEAENENRNKGCSWCYLDHNKYLLDSIYELNDEIPNYCPWCGRRLFVS